MTYYIPASAWSSSSPDLRDHLIRFWLAAPTDLLESIWKSKIGEVTFSSVKDLTSNYPFTSDQVDLRNRLGALLSENGLNHPLSLNLMLANMLLSPPGLLKINNVGSYFPIWFADVYRSLYDSSDNSPVFQPATSPNIPSSSSSIPVVDNPTPSPSSSEVENDSFIPPVLPPFPGNISDLVSDRLQLNRLLGLSNLYYIDPDDAEMVGSIL